MPLHIAGQSFYYTPGHGRIVVQQVVELFLLQTRISVEAQRSKCSLILKNNALY